MLSGSLELRFRLTLTIALGSLWPYVVLADPFRGTDSSVPARDAPTWMPEVVRASMGWLLLVQRQLVGDLQHHISAIRDGGSTMAVFIVIAVAAIYGVVHAAGPGHGKFVVVSYLSSRRARILQAVKMSAAMSLTQALSAIFLVSLFSVLLGVGSRTLMAGAAWFQTASFGLIGAFGIAIAARAVKGDVHCHDHGPDCGHHDHGGSRARGEILLGAMAIGLRPCTGALLVLLFTFANGLYWLGITATLAMAVGSAITIALVGLGAIGAHSLVGRIGASASAEWLARAVAVIGGAVIAVLGFVMMAATWGLELTG